MAPIIHEWTYEAMAYDLLGLKGSTFKYDSMTAGGKTEPKEHILDERDQLWVCAHSLLHSSFRNLKRCPAVLADLVWYSRTFESAATEPADQKADKERQPNGSKAVRMDAPMNTVVRGVPRLDGHRWKRVKNNPAGLDAHGAAAFHMTTAVVVLAEA